MIEQPPRLHRDLLVEAFHDYGRPAAAWRVGVEFERFLLRSDGGPVGYGDPDGVRSLLEEMAAEGPWDQKLEGGFPVGLSERGGDASITMEPGGQVELSGSPRRDLLEVAEEYRRVHATFGAIARARGLFMPAIGFTPYAPVESIPWGPKSRYRIMREYLGRTGDLAHHMMKGTVSVQVNLDYGDEGDLARKVRAAAVLAPLTGALFANSPFAEGRDTGMASFRAHIWSRTDPDRTGLPPPFSGTYSHEAWVDWLLEVPMMFVFDGQTHLPAHGATFRRFMEEGLYGRRATMADWEIHQTSVFPVLRVKRTLEIRGKDCVRWPMAAGAGALWAGLLYDRAALDQALALGRDLQRAAPDRDVLATEASVSGLRAMAGGRPLSAWVRDLLAVARRGLSAWQPGAESLIDPLDAQAETGRSPADELREAFARDPSPGHMLPLMGD